MKKSHLFILSFAFLATSAFSQSQLLEVPEVTNNYTERTQLGYVQSEDAINGMTYAYLAYLEKDLNTSNWVIYIKGEKTAGAKLDPNHSAFKRKCVEAAGTDNKYFIHGFSILPRQADARNVEFRIYVDNSGNPTELELYLVTRNADGSAKEAVSEKIKWPSA